MFNEIVWKKFEWIFTDWEEFCIVASGQIHNYVTNWDCCSESYVSNIECNVSNTIKSLHWQKIIWFQKMPEEEWTPTLQEEDTVYWYDIELEYGHLYITYRNSSNWYYWWWCVYEWVIPSTEGQKEILEKYISPNV